jgi:hypothetical protein
VRRPLLGRTRDSAAMTAMWEISQRETGITFDI